MKKQFHFRCFVLTLLIAVTAVMSAGCGSSSAKSASYDGYSGAAAPAAAAAPAEYKADNGIYTSYAMEDAFEEEAVEAPEEAYADTAAQEGASGEIRPENSSRKLIKNMSYNVETEDLDGLDSAIKKRTAELGGYIESSYVDGVKYDKDYYENLYKNSSRRVYNTRSANYTVRIPVQNLELFSQTIEEEANVTSSNLNVQDITLEYVDVESHISSLRQQQKRLDEMMEKAETVEDMIEIENALSQVRYELQNYQSQMNVFNNQVSYSTISIYVQEVTKLSEVRELTDLERLGKGFVDNLLDLLDGIKEFLIWFVIHIPNIILWIVILYAAYRLWRWLKAKKAAKGTEKPKRRGGKKLFGFGKKNTEAAGLSQGKEMDGRAQEPGNDTKQE